MSPNKIVKVFEVLNKFDSDRIKALQPLSSDLWTEVALWPDECEETDSDRS